MTSDPIPVRVAPGTRREIGLVNSLIARAIGLATGGGPPNVFTTLARNRGLFRRWLLFAGGLMPGGKLPRADSELMILRTAHNCNCAYELDHHRRLGVLAGLSDDQVVGAEAALSDGNWSDRQLAMLHAADELHTERVISQQTWDDLAGHLPPNHCIELCLLVGHYEMLAMTLNSLGTPLDQLDAGPSSRIGRAIRSFASR